MNERLQSLLPWYVNGRLDDADRREVDAWLQGSEEARNLLAFWQAAADDQCRSAAIAAEDVGLDRVLGRINAPSASSASVAKRPRLLTRIAGWLDGAWLKPAFATALVVIAVQTTLLSRSEAPMVYRGAAPLESQRAHPGISADAALVRVVFDPASTEGQLRIVLAGSGAWLVGGPGRSGEYYLAVASDRADRLLQQLAASGIVVTANPVEHLPEAPTGLDN